MDFLPLFLPAIIFLGMVTSYEDIKTGKLRNKWVLFGLVYSLVLTLLILLFLFLSGQPVNPGYILDYSVNVLISLSFGFLIWYSGLWSAGDAKLFLAYASLVPLSVYVNGYILYFPAFTILINTFIPLSIFLVARILVESDSESKLSALKNTFGLRNFSESMVSLFGVSLLLRFLLSLLNIQIGVFFMLVLVFLFYGLLGMFPPKKSRMLGLSLAVLMVVINHGSIFSLEFLYYFLYVAVFFIVFRYFIFELGYEFFSKEVSIKSLKPGMIPAEVVYREGEKYAREKLILSSFASIFKKRGLSEAIFDFHCLTKEDIKKLKNLLRRGKLDSEMLRVYQTVPFAPFMLAGVVLTLIFKGNILTFVLNLL